jgi:cytochrome o ubiquinol oxidase operon protein cyoD
MSGPAPDKRREIWSYVAGYGLALALTAGAFAAVRWRIFPARSALGVVLGLALAQMIVHFRFFLHVDFKRSSRDRLWLVLFSGLIIALMVAGTLVVLFNLRQRMM